MATLTIQQVYTDLKTVSANLQQFRNFGTYDEGQIANVLDRHELASDLALDSLEATVVSRFGLACATGSVTF